MGRSSFGAPRVLQFKCNLFSYRAPTPGLLPTSPVVAATGRNVCERSALTPALSPEEREEHLPR
jgi:hypothetical protein